MNFFDLHSDTPFECFMKKQDFMENNLAVSGEFGGCFDNWFQTFAFFIRDDLENPYNFYKKMYSDFSEKLKNRPPNLKPIFAVEGGAVLEDDSDCLFELKKDGIKFLTLTWNGENLIAGGMNSNKGLNDFGKEVINKMNSLKIGCDLSHLNKKSFYSALEYAEFPLATHSNCSVICEHPRNLDETQIKLICERKGVMGLCFYPLFLGGCVFEKIYENIFYLCDKGYENNIAIGSDFDGAEMSSELDNISKIPHLYGFLEQRGISKDILNKIFYENAYNFIANLKKVIY